MPLNSLLRLSYLQSLQNDICVNPDCDKNSRFRGAHIYRNHPLLRYVRMAVPNGVVTNVDENGRCTTAIRDVPTPPLRDSKEAAQFRPCNALAAK
jgi:hypothetical protein